MGESRDRSSYMESGRATGALDSIGRSSSRSSLGPRLNALIAVSRAFTEPGRTSRLPMQSRPSSPRPGTWTQARRRPTLRRLECRHCTRPASAGTETKAAVPSPARGRSCLGETWSRGGLLESGHSKRRQGGAYARSGRPPAESPSATIARPSKAALSSQAPHGHHAHRNGSSCDCRFQRVEQEAYECAAGVPPASDLGVTNDLVRLGRMLVGYRSSGS